MRKVLIFILAFCYGLMSFSSCYADAFYRNLKEELVYALSNEAATSTQGYSVSKTEPVNGVVVGFDLVSNKIFIIGEVSRDKYELCTWTCRGQNFNNMYVMYDLIVTDGIVDEISPETPITFLYRYGGNEDVKLVYLEDEESAFILQAQLHGWDY